MYYFDYRCKQGGRDITKTLDYNNEEDHTVFTENQ